jgi:hypothetical protein
MKSLVTAVALAAGATATIAAIKMTSADAVSLPPAVIQALSLPQGDDA